MRLAPRGFTLPEMLIVIVMITMLSAFALPKFAVLRESGNIAGARQYIEAAIVTARSTAIQKGRPAQINVVNDQVSVTTTALDGTTIQVMPAMPLDQVYHVELGATVPTITYDARGFASPRLAAPAVFRVRGSTRHDSVCVTIIGQMMPRGCTL